MCQPLKFSTNMVLLSYYQGINTTYVEDCGCYNFTLSHILCSSWFLEVSNSFITTSPTQHMLLVGREVPAAVYSVDNWQLSIPGSILTLNPLCKVSTSLNYWVLVSKIIIEKRLTTEVLSFLNWLFYFGYQKKVLAY